MLQNCIVPVFPGQIQQCDCSINNQLLKSVFIKNDLQQ